MINYSKGITLKNEKVDHEMHIFKIKIFNLIIMGFVLISSVRINILYGIIIDFFLIFFFRYTFKLEEKGVPLEYDPKFLKFAKKLLIYPTIVNPSIIQPRKEYRE